MARKFTCCRWTKKSPGLGIECMLPCFFFFFLIWCYQLGSKPTDQCGSISLLKDCWLWNQWDLMPFWFHQGSVILGTWPGFSEIWFTYILREPNIYLEAWVKRLGKIYVQLLHHCLVHRAHKWLLLLWVRTLFYENYVQYADFLIQLFWHVCSLINRLTHLTSVYSIKVKFIHISSVLGEFRCKYLVSFPYFNGWYPEVYTCHSN